jgi:hypothetical protein
MADFKVERFDDLALREEKQNALARASILNKVLRLCRRLAAFSSFMDLLPLAHPVGRSITNWWTPAAHLPSAPLNLLGSRERRRSAIG